MICTLLWHRIEWGFQEWLHEITFFNFWNGSYIVISGAVLLLVTSSFGIYALRHFSICWLVTVGQELPVKNPLGPLNFKCRHDV